MQRQDQLGSAAYLDDLTAAHMREPIHLMDLWRGLCSLPLSQGGSIRRCDGQEEQHIMLPELVPFRPDGAPHVCARHVLVSHAHLVVSMSAAMAMGRSVSCCNHAQAPARLRSSASSKPQNTQEVERPQNPQGHSFEVGTKVCARCK